MNKLVKFTLLFVLFGLLVLVRVFENQLFYDPYLTFFQNDYLYIDSPRREIAKLIAFTTFRYALNSIISLAILYVVFRDKSIIKFSVLIFVIAFCYPICCLFIFCCEPQARRLLYVF